MIFFWVWFLVGITSMTVIAFQIVKGKEKVTWREVGFFVLGVFLAGLPSYIISR